MASLDGTDLLAWLFELVQRHPVALLAAVILQTFAAGVVALRVPNAPATVLRARQFWPSSGFVTPLGLTVGALALLLDASGADSAGCMSTSALWWGAIVVGGLVVAAAQPALSARLVRVGARAHAMMRRGESLSPTSSAVQLAGLSGVWGLVSTMAAASAIGLLETGDHACLERGSGQLAWLLTLPMALSIPLHNAARRRRAQARESETSFAPDALTGLLVRPALQRMLEAAAPQAQRDGLGIGLIYIGLDGFKVLNESYGHVAGDAVLRTTATRLLSAAQLLADESTDRLQILVGRASGDEFVLAVHGDVGRASLSEMSAALLDALRAPYTIDDHPVHIGGSIGIASFPRDGAVSTLIEHADSAMRGAKEAGGSTYAFFEARREEETRDRVQLLRDLREALGRGQLELVYQPKVDARSGQITAAEALLRWHHATRGTISPGTFIPLAERYGLIVALGDWVIEEACRQARVWLDAGLRMRVAINVSAAQMRQDDLVERIQAALNKYGIEPNRLTCEITETLAMEDTRATHEMLKRLGAAGVHVSIDDFGTGYSSLSYLRQLPATEIKIDRSFVMDLDKSKEAAAIVGAIVQIGHQLGLKVVAEGVETEGQYRALTELGCDELQGYLFARPMPAHALTLWAASSEHSGHSDFRQSLYADIKTVAA